MSDFYRYIQTFIFSSIFSRHDNTTIDCVYRIDSSCSHSSDRSVRQRKSTDFLWNVSEYRQGNIRERRSVDLIQWQSALNLLNQLYPEKNERGKISGTPFEYRSLPGPINIEQLPAILASRYVQRYPYSSQNDPSVM